MLIIYTAKFIIIISDDILTILYLQYLFNGKVGTVGSIDNNTPSISGGFRGVSEVSTEPPFGLHLVIRSTDDRLKWNPLSGYRTNKINCCYGLP